MKKDNKFNIRRRMREIALKILFQLEFSESDKIDFSLDERIKEIFEDETSNPEGKIRNTNVRFSSEIITGVVDKKKELDSFIKEFSDNWDFDRISLVDLNILRMSIYELLYIENIPASVTINEAIEISKSYGDKGTFRFINGILNGLRKSKKIEKF